MKHNMQPFGCLSSGKKSAAITAALLVDAGVDVAGAVAGLRAIDASLMGATCGAVLIGLAAGGSRRGRIRQIGQRAAGLRRCGAGAEGGITTCSRLPRGDWYFGGSQGSGRMMVVRSSSDCARAGKAGTSAASIAKAISQAWCGMRLR
jgi:hypothetical protein